MKFEIGKTYQHSSGKRMTIIGRLKTHIYGVCLISEDDIGELHPVSEAEEDAINWYEVEEMTREEAIKILKSKMDGRTDTSYEWAETVRMAIKALEQESTNKNDLAVECINRAELLKAMNTWDKFGNDPILGLIRLITPALQDRYVPYVKYDDMVKCVKGMSLVTPIRPKGHWVLTDVEGNKVWHCRCSECGKDPQDYIGGSEDWWLIKNNLPKFCPSCGSDNREVVKE